MCNLNSTGSNCSLYSATVEINPDYELTTNFALVLLAVAWPLNLVIIFVGMRIPRENARFQYLVTILTCCNMYSLLTCSIFYLYLFVNYTQNRTSEISFMLCSFLRHYATIGAAPFYAGLMAIALDRVRVICYDKTMQKCTIFGLTTLGLAFQLCSNAIEMFAGDRDNNADPMCTRIKSGPPYFTYFLAIVAAGAHIFILICNSRILLFIRRQRKLITQTVRRHSVVTLDKERQVAVSLMSQALAPICTSFPYIALLTLQRSGTISYGRISGAAITALCVSNFILSPIIFVAFVDSYRQAFCSIFGCQKRSVNGPQRSTSSIKTIEGHQTTMF